MTPPAGPEELYLDLLKRLLTRYQFESPYRALRGTTKLRSWTMSLLQKPLGLRA